MDGFLMMLNNFLTSGFDFSADEHELRSKIILTNSMIAFGILFLVVLTLFLFLNDRTALGIANIVSLAIGFAMIYALRMSKDAYKVIIPLLVLTEILLIAFALTVYPDEQVRISWLIVIIILAYFLGGRWIGAMATVLSILTVFLVDLYVGLHLDAYALFLTVAIILLSAVFIDLYERRSLKAKTALLDINQNLQTKIKEETQKRTEMYRQSNQKLIEGAKELEDQKAIFQHLAHHDTLTGLPNRILFRDRLKYAIDKSERKKAKLAILFLDLDHFKEINDSLGHQLGDEVLKIISERLKESLRYSDSIARLGGDEYTVLIEDIEDEYMIADLARKLLEEIQKPATVKNHTLYLTISIGISIYPDDGQDAETLLKNADAAMYGAKKKGRNTYHFFTKEMTNQAYRRIMIESNIRNALENGEFLLYYQPQINSRTGKVVGLEALLRWKHPKKGLILPSQFIPLAEATELIIPLGRWVLYAAASQMVAWRSKGIDPVCIFVNLSVKQLRHKSIIPTIKEVLSETGCRAPWLGLEITEGYTMQNPNQSIALLQRIRAMGLNLALDDFGTGYSSLSYLKRLPVNKLKIDKSFIDDIPGNREDEAIVSAIVLMAKSMGIDVIAEGVETDAQKVFLREAGCDIIQGYLYAKAIPAEKAEEMICTVPVP